MIRTVIFALITLMIVGCSTFQAQPDRVGYYRLEARLLTPGVPLFPESIVAVTVPDTVDHKKLALPEGPPVVISDFDRWVEPFGKGVERVLDLNVRALLGSNAEESVACSVNILEARLENGALEVWLDYHWIEETGVVKGAFSSTTFVSDTGPVATAEAWSKVLELVAQELVNARR